MIKEEKEGKDISRKRISNQHTIVILILLFLYIIKLKIDFSSLSLVDESCAYVFVSGWYKTRSKRDTHNYEK